MSAGSSHICFGNFAHNCDTCYNLKSPAFSIETLLQGYFGKLISNFFVLHFIFYPKHHFSHLQDKKYYCTLKIKSVWSFTLHCLHFFRKCSISLCYHPSASSKFHWIRLVFQSMWEDDGTLSSFTINEVFMSTLLWFISHLMSVKQFWKYVPTLFLGSLSVHCIFIRY